MKSAAGDRVALEAPGGTEYLTVLRRVLRAHLMWNSCASHREPSRRQAVLTSTNPVEGRLVRRAG
jgi:hypothetical protein